MIDISDKEFHRLAKYIHNNYGIYLKEEKRALVVGRLRSLLIQNQFTNFSDYCEYVISDRTGAAAEALINRITTNHTYFMREEEHFYYLRDRVLPFLESTIKDRDLRIWSAGCSTGEEPYTMAMVIGDFFGNRKMFWDTKILATDISSQVLKQAAQGIYSNDKISSLPPKWRMDYFRGYDDQNSILKDSIKNEIIFRKFNLMERVFPFKRKFHVIFCRNVMIYFDARTKRDLVNKFYDSMENGGYLFIGHSESLIRGETPFKYIRPALYRKE
ncbi:MAG: protein-glutamate O-methyltransferase CheR [Clostridiales bacterium]|nr:protein-glutamate O-methyltransferase CheR [Clostridiales bacterium]